MRAAVTGLIRDIEREFGGLNGIIHAAGIIRDNAHPPQNGTRGAGRARP